MSQNPLDKHYESLSKLYLRLKGYFITNLIIHSEEHGREKTELDIVATRMPFHSQEYRQVEADKVDNDYLKSSNTRIEILICEVKNYKKIDNVEFNEKLREDKESIKQLIEWIGIYKNVDDEQVEKFKDFFNLHKNDWDDFAEFPVDTAFAKYTIKFTFFCPSLPQWDGNGFKYIHGDEMFDFIWECLNTMKIIETSSRKYNYEHWNELEEYTRFFKNKNVKVTREEFEEEFKQN